MSKIVEKPTKEELRKVIKQTRLKSYDALGEREFDCGGKIIHRWVNEYFSDIDSPNENICISFLKYYFNRDEIKEVIQRKRSIDIAEDLNFSTTTLYKYLRWDDFQWNGKCFIKEIEKNIFSCNGFICDYVLKKDDGYIVVEEKKKLSEWNFYQALSQVFASKELLQRKFDWNIIGKVVLSSEEIDEIRDLDSEIFLLNKTNVKIFVYEDLIEKLKELRDNSCSKGSLI